jgi:GNAT superfamily N-acetyltransferase
MDGPEAAPILRPGGTADAAACAAIFNAWVDATDWMPRVHSAASVQRHYREHVLVVCRVIVADLEGAVVGFVAVDAEGCVAGLFVAEGARGRGVGTALIEAAKAMRPEGLSLWTFEANAAARAFYARRGFVVDGGTADDNEEGLPDLRLTWSAWR